MEGFGEADEALGDRRRIRWTDPCPFNLPGSEQVRRHLERSGFAVDSEHVTRLEEAQQIRSPLGAYALEDSTGLLSHHLTADGATARLVERRLKR